MRSRPAGRERSVQQDPLFHTIVATDVEKSSGRNDNLLLRMRADLRDMLTSTLSRQNIDLAAVTMLDDGDGFRVLLPAGVPPHALLDPFVNRLGIELRAHRESAAAANRLRLRVALHSGLLHREESGSFTGRPLQACARLLDTPAGRELLTENPKADMVVLLTDGFYDDVVRSGTSLDPAWFRPIPIQVKETDGHGWAYLPGLLVPAARPVRPESAPAPQNPAPQSPATSSVSITGGTIGTIIGGNYYGRR